jgi:hypothetical protein
MTNIRLRFQSLMYKVYIFKKNDKKSFHVTWISMTMSVGMLGILGNQKKKVI